MQGGQGQVTHGTLDKRRGPPAPQTCSLQQHLLTPAICCTRSHHRDNTLVPALHREQTHRTHRHRMHPTWSPPCTSSSLSTPTRLPGSRRRSPRQPSDTYRIFSCGGRREGRGGGVADVAWAVTTSATQPHDGQRRGALERMATEKAAAALVHAQRTKHQNNRTQRTHVRLCRGT